MLYLFALSDACIYFLFVVFYIIFVIHTKLGRMVINSSGNICIDDTKISEFYIHFT